MIGGWLPLIGLQFVAIALALGWLLVTDLTERTTPFGSLAFTALQLGFVVVTCVAFARRKRIAVPLMLGFFVFAIVAAIAGEGTGRWQAQLPAMNEMAGLARLIDVARTAFLLGPSMTYLARAERVRKTFVLP